MTGRAKNGHKQASAGIPARPKNAQRNSATCIFIGGFSIALTASQHSTPQSTRACSLLFTNLTSLHFVKQSDFPPCPVHAIETVIHLATTYEDKKECQSYQRHVGFPIVCKVWLGVLFEWLHLVSWIVACVRSLPFATVFNPGELSVTLAWSVGSRDFRILRPYQG